jgi:cell division protein FtsN
MPRRTPERTHSRLRNRFSAEGLDIYQAAESGKQITPFRRYETPDTLWTVVRESVLMLVVGLLSVGVLSIGISLFFFPHSRASAWMSALLSSARLTHESTAATEPEAGTDDIIAVPETQILSSDMPAATQDGEPAALPPQAMPSEPSAVAAGTAAEVGRVDAPAPDMEAPPPAAVTPAPAPVPAPAKPVSHPAPAKKPAAPAVKVVSSPAAPALPAPSPVVWGVQVAALSDETQAKAFCGRLAQAGYDASVVQAVVAGKTIYRVRVASAGDRTSASAILEKLKAAGFGGILCHAQN